MQQERQIKFGSTVILQKKLKEAIRNDKYLAWGQVSILYSWVQGSLWLSTKLNFCRATRDRFPYQIVEDTWYDSILKQARGQGIDFWDRKIQLQKAENTPEPKSAA